MKVNVLIWEYEAGVDGDWVEDNGRPIRRHADISVSFPLYIWPPG